MDNISDTADFKEKFCIIGGGPIGIGIGKVFTQNKISFDIIEKESDFGGLWEINSEASKVYRSTHLISSKRNTQFSDYPMPDNYPDYPNHRLFLKYLRSLATHFNLYSHATFNTAVIHLDAIDDKYWKVQLSNGEERIYRGVLIATGRLSEPLMPEYPGKFSGLVLHSDQYKNPDIFKDKQVLIVGAGNSGCDIVIDAAHHAAKTIQSTRRGYHYMPKYIHGKPTQDWLMEIGTQFKTNKELWAHVKNIFKMAGFDGVDFGLPEPDHEIYAAHPIMNSQILYHIGHGDIQVKPDIQLIKEHSVVFTDNTEEELDVIIYATGFCAKFPFLPEKYNIKDQDNLDQLFMYMFSKQFDNLFFAGFLNAPSGLGNLANAAGRLLTNYVKALITQAPVLQIFNQLKQGPNLDLGQDIYIKTPRHKLEVDMWKFIKAVNFLSTKLAD